VQASCPQCGSKVAIDDAKVPDRAFSVKCPKCQSAIRLPGKTAAPSPSAAALPDAEPFSPPSPLSHEPALGSLQPRHDGGANRALVAVPDKSLAGQLGLTFSRLGIAVDNLDDWEEGARLLEQGVYQIVATARVAGQPGKGESLYQRINRLSPDGRRRLFLILAGDEFKTADGTQAFAVLADLVINSRDAGSAENVLRSTLGERQRLYQIYVDARRRHEEAAG